MLKVSDYLTVTQAAEYLGIHAQTLRNWDKIGKLVAYRWSAKRIRMYRREDLDKYLEGFEQSSREL